VSVGGKPGKDGKAAPKVEQRVALKGAVVSAMAQLPGGDLLAATLPGGVIYRVDAKGKISNFAELKVEQIWAIVPHQGRLLVGTGPKGELLSLDTTARTPRSSSTATRRTSSRPHHRQGHRRRHLTRRQAPAGR
jgi:ligand-binding sensor domain-containing protein